MPPSHGRKACVACAECKRKCGKELPSCNRCLDRGVHCIYPLPVRRQQKRIGTAISQFAALQHLSDATVLANSVNFGSWSSVQDIASDNGISASVVPYLPTNGLFDDDFVATATALDQSHVPSLPSPWFLQDETWNLESSSHTPACVTIIQLEPFIDAVGEMLRCWVTSGHNSFIHWRLYRLGMPTCLQDAFTTFATYTGRSVRTRETILQIVENRLFALTNQTPSAFRGSEAIRDQLARVQAMFVYEFIGLFDGSVRLRSAAQQRLPTLRRWTTRMWEVTKMFQLTKEGEPEPHWAASELDRDYHASSASWELWLLTESVRRTHLVVDTVANIYEIMAKGYADCTGAAMFTGRRGLWEAESAKTWFKLCDKQSPLLVSALQPDSLISKYAATEFDSFAILYWTFIVGPDKIQWWTGGNNDNGDEEIWAA